MGPSYSVILNCYLLLADSLATWFTCFDLLNWQFILFISLLISGLYSQKTQPLSATQQRASSLTRCMSSRSWWRRTEGLAHGVWQHTPPPTRLVCEETLASKACVCLSSSVHKFCGNGDRGLVWFQNYTFSCLK